MKKEKILQITFCAFFCLFLSLPLVFINRNPETISVIENKRVAGFPRLSFRSFFDRNSLSLIENFFDENIGFRQKLILKNIKYMYKIFKKLEVPNHTLGKDGHIFYMNDGIMKTYQGIDFENLEQIKVLGSELVSVSDEFKKLDTNFIFCPIPNKEEIYPEFMPDGINRIRNDSMLKNLAYYLKDNTNFHCVNMYDVLSGKKNSINSNSDLLYYKNLDCSHWNSYGAYFGYKAIIDKIKSISPEIRCLSEDEIKITKNVVKKAIHYLQQYPDVAESLNMTDFLYLYNYSFNGHSDNSVPESFSMRNDKTNTYFHYENKNNTAEKTLLVFGDSYIWTFLLPLLSESFKHVYFLSNAVNNEIKYELYDMTKPDFTILETVARMTYYDGLLSYIKDLREVFGSDKYKERQIRKKVFDDFESLPLNNKDCFLIFDNGTRTIKLKENGYTLSGWAIDSNLDDSPLAVILVIGEKKYICDQFDRPDIAASNIKYLKSGFSLKLEADCEFNDETYMYVISKDKTKSNKIFVEVK